MVTSAEGRLFMCVEGRNNLLIPRVDLFNRLIKWVRILFGLSLSAELLPAYRPEILMYSMGWEKSP